MTRKLTIIGLILVLMAASASAGIFNRGEKGSGDLVETDYDLDTCTSILLECGLDIDITFGNKQSVTLIMDDNLVEYYDIDERSGTLVVDADDNPRPSRKARLELTLRSLDEVKIEGAGDINIEDFDDDELVIEIEGAGDIEATGKVERLEIEVNGAGDIDTRGLKAQDANVVINGAGDVKVYASKSCDVVINGVGDVDVYGKPENFHKNVNGIGDVDRK